jgi:glycosyltransferase involved in cell wall biosynthesis
MRIGLNLLYLLPGRSGGTETYAAGLINSLAEIDQENEYFVFLNEESCAWPLPELANFNRVVCPIFATSRMRRYFYEQVVFPRMTRKFRLDLLHSLGYVAPLMIDCPSVVSTLDIVYNSPGGYSFPKKQLLRYLVNNAARKAQHIVTISQASSQQIVSGLNISPDKITVTLLAPRERRIAGDDDGHSVLARLGVRGDYLLAFSSTSPNKNIPTLLESFANLRPELSANLQLVLAGHEPLRGTPLREFTDKLGVQGNVIFSGYLSDGELATVLKRARVFVFPSLYEGFGLPILEAMQAGVPVVSSNAASLPEVCGDAALLFNPRSPADLTATLEKLLLNPKLCAEFVAKGHANLEHFSWKFTAERTLQVYRQVFSESSSALGTQFNKETSVAA